MPSSFRVYYGDYQIMCYLMGSLMLAEFSLRDIADMFLKFSSEKGILQDYIFWWR